METIDEENLELRLQDASKPLLVNFSASWCRPCRRIERSLTLVEEELAERVDFVKVDVDGAERLARKFGICAVPTLVLHARGRTVDTVSGVFSAAFLREWIEQKLQNDVAVESEGGNDDGAARAWDPSCLHHRRIV